MWLTADEINSIRMKMSHHPVTVQESMLEFPAILHVCVSLNQMLCFLNINDFSVLNDIKFLY